MHTQSHRRFPALPRCLLLAWAVVSVAVPASAQRRDDGTKPPAAGGSALLPPVTPACISSPFGARVLPNRPLAGRFHNGIDLPAPAGAPVRAVAPGTVIRAVRRGPGGLQLLVQHDGFVGVYSHLGSIAPAIADGRRAVVGGEKIGVVGHSGVTYGMHLFFAMMRNGHFVDPAPYLEIVRCGAATAAGRGRYAGKRIRHPSPGRP